MKPEYSNAHWGIINGPPPFMADGVSDGDGKTVWFAPTPLGQALKFVHYGRMLLDGDDDHTRAVRSCFDEIEENLKLAAAGAERGRGKE